MSPRDLLVTSLVAIMALTPLVALTVIAGRWRRGRWWMAAPWGIGFGLWLIMLQLFYSFGMAARDPGRMGSAMIGAAFLTSWLALCIVLIALTIAGPKLPPPGVVTQK